VEENEHDLEKGKVEEKIERKEEEEEDAYIRVIMYTNYHYY